MPSFTVVGMVAFFGTSAKVPLSTLILISEMTGGYVLLVPAMLSIFTAYLISGKSASFQVRSIQGLTLEHTRNSGGFGTLKGSR